MTVSANELLLALRAPTSGWLAALVCALEEALRDPAFGEPQRRMVQQLLAAGHVPYPVAHAANERLASFEATVQDLQSLMGEIDEPEPAPVAQRPKLTLCVGGS